MIARRYAAVGAALTATALALAGCAGATPSTDPTSEEDVELSMLVNITPNLTEEWWNDLVAPFEEANPHIDVKIQAPSQEGVKNMLPQLLAAGTVPDIVQTVVPTAELAPELVDLSEYEWATTAPLADKYTIDGKYLMTSVGYQLQGLFYYNKQAFEDAGIEEVPTTLEELDKVLGKLKDAGWTPIQSGGEWMSQYVVQASGLPTILSENPDWFQEISGGDVTFSETYGDTIERYADWVAKGYIPAEQVGVKYADAEAQFLAGNAAIYPMGAWFASSEANATDKPEIGAFPAPAAEGVDNPARSGGAAGVYIMMKAGKHHDESAQLLEFLSTDKDAVTEQLSVDGNYRDGYPYEMTPLQEDLLKIVSETPVEDFYPFGDGFGERTMPAGYAAELNTQTQALLTGATPDAVLAAMDAWFEANRK